jgi:ubiquinone/menaquinone biosynthesis C-methylase UbiE
MDHPIDTSKKNYESLYEEFDSPLMRELRQEAYGEDIGQHSWVTAAELRRDAVRLGMPTGGQLLDLGCGPCGPLTFVMKSVGCHGIGLDVSTAALEAGHVRAQSLGVDARIRLQETDLDGPIPLDHNCVDAAMSLDVVLHLRDRLRVFREVTRVLKRDARLLFTDAGVVTGSISNEEVTARCMHGFSQFCAPGFNEKMLEHAGLVLLETENRTAALMENATGRLAARLKHQAELERIEGAVGFTRYQEYLQSVISMSERGALSRMMYLGERRAD